MKKNLLGQFRRRMFGDAVHTHSLLHCTGTALLGGLAITISTITPLHFSHPLYSPSRSLFFSLTLCLISLSYIPLFLSPRCPSFPFSPYAPGQFLPEFLFLFCFFLLFMSYISTSLSTLFSTAPLLSVWS